MGKYIVEYGVPGLLLVLGLWVVLDWWYRKHFHHHVKAYQARKKASKKYEKELGK
jgi:fatty acid desaturase